MSFDTLAPCFAPVLEQLDIHTPTIVQRELIPLVEAGQDVLVGAETGSGKTLAYVLPLLARYGKGRRRPVLIIVPTRELVKQIASVIAELLPAVPGCKVVELAGGSSINTQLKQLRGGADFLLATPGRLLDVIARNGIDPGTIDVLVLDEADRLLGDGFQEALDELMSRIDPAQRLMISATYTRKVRAKAGWILKKPVLLDLSGSGGNIRHRAIQVDEQRRLELLLSLFDGQLPTPSLIFTADRHGAERLARDLAKAGRDVKVLHGKLSMAQRATVLRLLEEQQLQVLVASDLAARGIDIPRLPLVINYDLPRSVELYTHRAGRTARAGETGEAISLVDINAEAHLALIEKRLGMIIPREQIPGFEPRNALRQQLPMTDGNGGIKGRRMSKKDKLRAAAAREKREAEDSEHADHADHAGDADE